MAKKAGFFDALIGMSPWGGKPAAAEAKRTAAEAARTAEETKLALARGTVSQQEMAARSALLAQEEAIAAARWARLQPLVYLGVALTGTLLLGWLLTRK